MNDIYLSTLQVLERKGMLVHLDISNKELQKRVFQTVGHCICEECGSTYDRHPYIDDFLNYNRRPYLHLLCDGRLANL
jgi:Fe2+ or Zn2+ uptake regulation protein